MSAPALHQPTLLHRSLEERGKQRVRREGRRFELGVILHADELRMIFVLDDLRQGGRDAAMKKRHLTQRNALHKPAAASSSNANEAP